MLKEQENSRKYGSRSPPLSSMQNNQSRMRRSISPKRYCAALENIESRKSSCQANSLTHNGPVKIPDTSSGIRSSGHITKFSLSNTNVKSKKKSTPRLSDNIIGIKKTSQKPAPVKKPATSSFKNENLNIYLKAKHGIKHKIQEYQNRLNSVMHDEINSPALKPEESFPKPESKRIPLAVLSIQPKPPRPKARSTSSDKRKLPSRYLRIEISDTLPKKPPEPKPNYIEMDLKLIQDTNSETLLKNLEADKITRLHREGLRNNSILKNAYEEESWNWSSPEVSPVKHRFVQFSNNLND